VRSPATFTWPDWNASCREFLVRLLELEMESRGEFLAMKKEPSGRAA
jgi:hypothetical protein